LKAVVLVGGEGTRLRPLTETIPKPLLPFMNRPFLDHVLDHLGGHGVNEAILSSSYLESQFHGYLEGRTTGPAVMWITEEVPLGTSGAIAGARKHLDDTFLVLNGDVLTDLDLGTLLGFHRDRRAVATIALTRVEDARPFGLVERKPDGRVVAFTEKPGEPIPGDINAGTYVLEPRALDRVPVGVPASIERQTFPDLIARGEPVYAFLSDGYWLDLGTPAAYLQAHVDALEGRIAGRRYPRPLLAEGARLAPGSSVAEDVVIGERATVRGLASVRRSVIHAGAEIGESAVVEGSILGPGSVVEPEAVVRGSVLAEGARVPAEVRLEDAQVSAGHVAG
jgi:mannose-1-phosphate guanylyltransferase